MNEFYQIVNPLLSGGGPFCVMLFNDLGGVPEIVSDILKRRPSTEQFCVQRMPETVRMGTQHT